MKKIIVNILIGSLLTYSFCTLLTGCTDRNTSDCDEAFRDLSDEIKAYAPYTVGNYWVYQLKSDTTILDTLTCTFRTDFENDLDDDNSYGGANPCTKLYQATLQHSNIHEFKSEWDTSRQGVEEIKVYSSVGDAIKVTRRLSGDASSIAYGDAFRLSYELNKIVGGTGFIVSNDSESLILKKETYNNVIITKLVDNNYSSINHVLDSVYWVKGIGIAQYKDDEDTWQLIDFNIQ